MLFAFISYKLQFIGRTSSLIDKSIEYRMLGLHRDRVADIALCEPEREGPVDERVPAPADLSLEAVNLGFRYSESDPFVFRGLNLRIAAGEAVAIVGPSGCGKTTLIKVLLGLLPATEGEVRVGGIALDRFSSDVYRQLIGAVMQEDQLFAGSIAENIGFFDPQVDMEWIEQCGRMASIHEDIVAMPMAYQTLIGDMGSALSGGQRQRVLIARALYRRPRMLFLDEATSHLDADRERAVNAVIDRMDLTRVIVAHRRETIAMADRVIDLAALAASDALATAAHSSRLRVES
jgi:ATP-binding cassette, subfamily B, bacterial CvaB/MchF/RaxB